MTYDLAVWEGDPPANDVAAGEEFTRLYGRYIDSDEIVAPTPRMAAYVAALLARYPDLGTDGGDDSPWSSGPLINEAVGPLMYFPMVWSSCEETSEWAARLAEEHGLNCYDPQSSRLRTPARAPWQFELTSAGGGSLRDPDADQVRGVLADLSPDNYYALLDRADGWYVQVGYGERAGTRAGWFALERQDGTLDQHFRTELPNVDLVGQAFVAFLDRDPTVADRFEWEHYPL